MKLALNAGKWAALFVGSPFLMIGSFLMWCSQRCHDRSLALTRPEGKCQPQGAQVLEALELAEDVLSRSPFSTAIWPNGMHPQVGIEKIRAALALISERATDSASGASTPDRSRT